MPAETVVVETVRPLRHQVLRPGWPEEDSVYPHDDHPFAVHVALRVVPDGPPVAVGSLLPEDPPGWLAEWPGVPPVGSSGGGGGGAGGRWWRIRGMAAAEEFRGRGYGRAVLALLLDRAQASGGGVVWCNARLGALSLYRRAGFHEAGETFDLPGIGPHRTLWLVLPAR